MNKNIRPRKRNQANPHEDPKISQNIFTVLRTKYGIIGQRALFIIARILEFHLINEDVSYMGHQEFGNGLGISIRSVDDPFYILVELEIAIRDYRQGQTNIYRINRNLFNLTTISELMPYFKRSLKRIYISMKKDLAKVYDGIISRLDYCRQDNIHSSKISSEFVGDFNPMANLELFMQLQHEDAYPFGPEPPWWEWQNSFYFP